MTMNNDLSDSMRVLLAQEETTYLTVDYLTTRTASTPMGGDRSSSMEGDNSHIVNEAHTGSKKRKLSQIDHDRYGGKEMADSSVAAETSTGTQRSREEGKASLKLWREQLCDWAYRVVDRFDCNREVVSIAMNYFDRYLMFLTASDNWDATATESKNRVGLAAMACLCLSLKLNEPRPLVTRETRSTMATILSFGGGIYTIKDMEGMEMDLLQCLNWSVHPPTPQLFLHRFLSGCESSCHEFHDLANYMVEVSTMDFFFVSYKPSEVSTAALLNASARLATESLAGHDLMERLSSHGTARISECQERLSSLCSPTRTDTHDPIPSSPTPQQGSKVPRTASPVSVTLR